MSLPNTSTTTSTPMSGVGVPIEKLVLSPSVKARIEQHGREGHPYEICGVLVGRLEGNTRLVTDIYPQRNERDDSPENRFLISPEMVRDAELRAMREGVDVLGYYHTHPDCPPVPSEFDREHAWPWYSYLILRVDHDGPKEMRSWQLTDDRKLMLEEPVEITETSR